MPHRTVTNFLREFPNSDRISLVRITTYICYRHSILISIAKLRNVVDGLQYMHDLGVVYGDLKGVRIPHYLHNSKLNSYEGQHPRQQSPASLYYITSALKGTLRWMSPELLNSLDGGTPT